MQNGSMSEWLGTGLQNRSQRFESAWNLENPSDFVGRIFLSEIQGAQWHILRILFAYLKKRV